MEQFDFEYRYTIQESMILQYQQALQKRAWIRILKWIATVIVVLHAILLVVLLLNAKEPVLFSDWMSICVEIALLVMILLSARISTKLAMLRSKKHFGGIIPETVARFGERIETTYCTAENALDYTQIRQVFCFEDGYAILFNNRRVLFLSYCGFTKGTFEGFKEFLREKRPDLMIPE